MVLVLVSEIASSLIVTGPRLHILDLSQTSQWWEPCALGFQLPLLSSDLNQFLPVLLAAICSIHVICYGPRKLYNIFCFQLKSMTIYVLLLAICWVFDLHLISCCIYVIFFLSLDTCFYNKQFYAIGLQVFGGI